MVLELHRLRLACRDAHNPLVPSIEMASPYPAALGWIHRLSPGLLLSVVPRLPFGLSLRCKCKKLDANQMAVWVASDVLCLELPCVWPKPEHPTLLPQKKRCFQQVLLSIIWMVLDRMAPWTVHLLSDRPDSSGECVLGSNEILEPS